MLPLWNCSFSTSLTNDFFTIVANGVPDHNAHNGQTPGQLTEQSKTYNIPTNPVAHHDTDHIEDAAYQLGAGAIGVAINGVAIYNWASGGCCDVGLGEIEEIDEVDKNDSLLNLSNI